jgi:hypothetical protein
MRHEAQAGSFAEVSQSGRRERNIYAGKCAPGGIRTHTPSVEYRVLYSFKLPGRVMVAIREMCTEGRRASNTRRATGGAAACAS